MLKIFNFLYENEQPDQAALKQYAISEVASKLLPRKNASIEQQQETKRICEEIADKLYAYFPTEFNIMPRQIFNEMTPFKINFIKNIIVTLYGKEIERIFPVEFLQLFSSLEEARDYGVNFFKIYLGVTPDKHLEQEQMNLFVQNMKKLALLLKNDPATLDGLAKILSILAKESINKIKESYPKEYGYVQYLGLSDYQINRSSVVDMIVAITSSLHNEHGLKSQFMKFLNEEFGGNIQNIFSETFNVDTKDIVNILQELTTLEKNMQNLVHADEQGKPSSLRYIETDEEGKQTVTKVDSEKTLYGMKAIKIIKLAFLILKALNIFVEKVRNFLQTLTNFGVLDAKFIDFANQYKITLKTFYESEIKPLMQETPEQKLISVFGDGIANLHKKFDKNQYFTAYDKIGAGIRNLQKIKERASKIDIVELISFRSSYTANEELEKYSEEFAAILEALNSIISYVDFNDLETFYIKEWNFDIDDLEIKFVKNNLDLVKEYSNVLG